MFIFDLLFFFFFVIIGLPLTALWIWAIVEVATKETSKENQQLIWLLVVILTGWIGALIYILVRRPERLRQLGA